MNFLDLIHKNEVISIVGAGGKTNLIRYLAKNLRDNNRVLITSTVEIERIPEGEIDFIDYQYRGDYILNEEMKNGTYLISSGITNDNLLREVSNNEVDSLTTNFDVSLIECDISKKRNFKAWRDNEPLVPDSTTLIIGVIDVTTIGKTLSVDSIYNLDVFMDITGKQVGDLIEENDLVKVITSSHGMFKKENIRKIIFINKAEDIQTTEKAIILGLKLSSSNIDEIIYGSINNDEFYFINTIKRDR